MTQRAASDKVVIIRPQKHTIGGVALSLLFVGAWGIAAAFGYAMLRANVTEDILRDRLYDIVEGEYRALRDRYNEAVRQTAVTELVVEGGRLSVRVRNAEGTIEEIPTDFDPSSEIYVDYVVVDGRLWIRRVFDDATPPSRGVVINPELATVDWEALPSGEPGEGGAPSFGQTIYRSIGEGRWMISVSGNGALSLSRVSPDTVLPLSAPPEVATYDELTRQIDAEVDRISPLDVLRRLVSGPEPRRRAAMGEPGE